MRLRTNDLTLIATSGKDLPPACSRVRPALNLERGGISCMYVEAYMEVDDQPSLRHRRRRTMRAVTPVIYSTMSPWSESGHTPAVDSVVVWQILTSCFRK